MDSGIGRWGNRWNQELFGKPTTLPWALKISPSHRPPGYLHDATFVSLAVFVASTAFFVWWQFLRAAGSAPVAELRGRV